MKRMARALASAELVLGRTAAVLLVLLLVLINVEVVARYVFNGSTLIADEYGGYIMAWMTMLGAVHLLRAVRHLTMTSVVDRLSPRARNAAALVAAFIGLAITLVLLYSTALLVIGSARFATVSIQPSATPLVWPQLILPVGYAVLALAYVDEIARRLAGAPPRVYDDDIGDSIE
jgi:TRAP-type C4-dicarboxylate transport system permease small subunit